MAEASPLIPAPSDPSQWPEWRRSLYEIRERGLTPEVSASYLRPEFEWVRHCLVCAKVMLFDREFYDEASNSFRVEKYVSRIRQDYGSLDGLVLWQAYPRIGFDSRNQFDHYRLTPNLEGVIRRLHALDVKAFLAYNPWDAGTRREDVGDADAIARTVKHFDFDGVFLDTLQEGDAALRAALDRVKPGVVMESELALPVGSLAANHASWAQWFDDSEAPGIMRNRWVERAHMMHVIRRWDLDHTSELQMAWMNGSGVLVWENVFGSWNGWSDRDKAILRSMTAIRRRYALLFDAGEWTPLTPTTLAGTYASKWSLGSAELHTLVNRTEQPVSGSVLPIASDGSRRLFDLIRGVEIDHGVLEIPARWIGGVLSIPDAAVDDEFRAFLASQAKMYEPKAGASSRIEPLTVRSATPRTNGTSALKDAVVLEARAAVVVSAMRARECGEYGPAPFGGSSYIPIHFERRFRQVVQIGNVAVCRQEVTNRQFQAFLESGDKTTNQEQLHHRWVHGKPAQSDLDKPVCFVSLDDARAYASWAGMRLPTECEWQIAVEEHELPHGELWNWTESEHFDGHTRFSILKGGCRWRAIGSDWYADSGPRDPEWSAKFIHFFPSLDRCETIGFRCAVDL